MPSDRKAGPKRNRIPLLNSPVFAIRGEAVKWPTLRGAYLIDKSILELRKIAFGVIFLEGNYNTRLNYDKKPSLERAVFFEHLHKVDGDQLFLLCWIGNYHAGSIFHCAWQFPQHLNWPTQPLEYAAYRTYRQVANILYADIPREERDLEVRQFLKEV
jgi:hypothetical protein